jgi:hypothetical protein
MEQGAMEKSEQWVLEVLERERDSREIEKNLLEAVEGAAGVDEPLNIDFRTGVNKKGLPWAEAMVW